MVWLYGVLVIGGGMMGWTKARSKPSLIAGLVAGALLFISGYAMWIGAVFGYWLGIGIAAGLLVTMGTRFLKTRKFMPAGLTALLSLATLVALLVLR
jgi:uncharacterized membrane protein (UPF0136 family)